MTTVGVAGRPLVGVSFGGTWSGSITNAVPQYETWWNTGGVTGHKVESITHFMYPSLSADGTSFTYPWSQCSGFYNTGGTVVMSMTGWPSGGTADLAIAGNYNSIYQTYGRVMAPYNGGRLVLRPMWECDLNWQPYGLPNIGVTKYQQVYRQLVTNVRIGGFTGPIEWNCASTNGFNAMTAFPGADVVNIMGVDKYADQGEPARSSDYPYCWTKYEQTSLDAAAAVATKYGLRLGLSEFGAGYGYADTPYPSPGWKTGDNYYYLQQLAAWIQLHDVAYANQFNNNDGSPIVNRFQWAVAATKDTAGPFTDDTANFSRTIPVWKSGTWLASNLAYNGTAAGQSALIPRTKRQRHTSLIFG